MNEAKKYRDEILKLVGTSKASSKACIDTSKIINTDKDSIDEKITEEIKMIKKDNRLAIFENTKPNINKYTKPNINKDTKDTKPNIDKHTKPSIEINKKTSLKVFHIVRNDIKNKRNW